MSVQQVLMTVIAKPNAKIRLAITSVLANKDFMEMEGQAAQVKKNLEKSKIQVQSIDLLFLWAFLIFFFSFFVFSSSPSFHIREFMNNSDLILFFSFRY